MKEFSRKIESIVCKTNKRTTEIIGRKRILMFFVCVCFGLTSVLAQDIITLKNGEDVKAYVQEIGDIDVKYKKFDNPNGPNYTLKKAEILIIRYENGTKDIFSEEEKSAEKKEISMPESTNVKNDENIETVYLPDNRQNRNDVIVGMVRGKFGGFQTKITHIDNKYIHFMAYKGKGKEKEKKIKRKLVSYTLTFSETAKNEKYPLQMDSKDFASLPIYLDRYSNILVFGTNISNDFSSIKQLYPDRYESIYKEWSDGFNLKNSGVVLSTLGIIFYFIIPPVGLTLQVIGCIKEIKGVKKIINVYQTCQKLCFYPNILEKYGIIMTPYGTIQTF